MLGNILKNGVSVPNLCIGTGMISNEAEKPTIKYYMSGLFSSSARKMKKVDMALPKVVDVAMKKGCSMFDTSRAYGGAEVVLGRTLKKYNRNDYFIVTKLSNYGQYRGDVRGAFESSLKRLGLEYIDMYLLHWPVDDIYIKSWKIIEKLYEEGLCRAIGVCNCNIHHIEKLKKCANIMPMINQFECHPLFTQNELREYCKKNEIKVMSYTSTARMNERLYKTKLVPISKKYNKSIAQIMLKWHQQIGNIPIVNSTSVSHMIENINIDDFMLDDEEIKQILKININSRLRYDPDNCDFTML